MDKKPYIVIAEDDLSYADVLKRKLENEGMEVTIARDGGEAMKSLRERKPDLLLLDLIMPNKNGFQVLEEIRKDKNLKSIKAVISSNLAQSEDREKVMKLGAVDYIVKSNISIQEVTKKVKEYLK